MTISLLNGAAKIESKHASSKTTRETSRRQIRFGFFSTRQLDDKKLTFYTISVLEGEYRIYSNRRAGAQYELLDQAS